MHSGSRCNEEAVSSYAQLRVARFLAGEPCEAYTETTVCHLFSKTKTSATTVRERFGEPRPPFLPHQSVGCRAHSFRMVWQSQFPDRHFAGFPQACALSLRTSGRVAWS